MKNKDKKTEINEAVYALPIKKAAEHNLRFSGLFLHLQFVTR
jgi:hypothetical protein